MELTELEQLITRGAIAEAEAKDPILDTAVKTQLHLDRSQRIKEGSDPQKISPTA